MIVSLVATALAHDPCVDMPDTVLREWGDEELGRLYRARGDVLAGRRLNALDDYEEAKAAYQAGLSRATKEAMNHAWARLRTEIVASEYETLIKEATINLVARCLRSGRDTERDTFLTLSYSPNGMRLRLRLPDRLGTGLGWSFGVGTTTGLPWVPVRGEPFLFPYAYGNDSNARYDRREWQRVERGTIVLAEMGFNTRFPIGRAWDFEMGMSIRPLQLLDFAVGQPSYAATVYDPAADCDTTEACPDDLAYRSWWFEDAYYALSFGGLTMGLQYVPVRGFSFGLGLSVMEGTAILTLVSDSSSDTLDLIVGLASPTVSIGTFFR